MDGWEVCAEIRKHSRVPKFWSPQKRDLRQGYRPEKGADDYIVKPFELKEVMARIHAGSGVMIRRRRNKKLSFDKLVIDMQSYELTVGGKKMDTPPKEFELCITSLQARTESLRAISCLTRFGALIISGFSHR
jgi:DNA-binding response OmpR family regulator